MVLKLLNNRYQIIRKLGSGGFGDTFLGEDSQLPSRARCVIKQLRPLTYNPQVYQIVQERFQREAAILEDLGSSSSQIPRLYAYFTEDDKFYLIQEYIEGQTLKTTLKQQGVFSESAVRSILVDLLPVLNFVHSKRIVHRDIKPDNIILRSADGKPVLIDFGAVRESMGTVFNSQGDPTVSIVIGTPGYMPPEQAAGRPVYSSDLYSLGITAIYLLTGKELHQLPTDPHTGEVAWHQFALNVSPTMMVLIDKAIAYHPGDRFSSAQEMLEALQSGFVSPAQPNGQLNPSSVPVLQASIEIQQAIPFSQTPAAGSTASTAKSGVNPILLGSIVAAIAMGASVIVGFALNKSSLQTTSPTPTVSASNPNTALRPSPETFVQNYFTLIKQGQLEDAWKLLSPRLQGNKTDSFNSFDKFWGEDVQKLEVSETKTVKTDTTTSTVDVLYRVTKRADGKEASFYSRFMLSWKEAENRWEINGVKTKRASVSS